MSFISQQRDGFCGKQSIWAQLCRSIKGSGDVQIFQLAQASSSYSYQLDLTAARLLAGITFALKQISVWGWLGGHDGQRSMGEFGQDTGVTPLLFSKDNPGIFNDHRESGPRFNVSSERRCLLTVVSPSLYRGVRIHTDHRVCAPCWSH